MCVCVCVVSCEKTIQKENDKQTFHLNVIDMTKKIGLPVLAALEEREKKEEEWSSVCVLWCRVV